MKLQINCETHYVPLPPGKEKAWWAALQKIVQDAEIYYARTNRNSGGDNEPESAGDPVDSVAAIHEERTNNKSTEHSKDAGNRSTLGNFTG
jgi:hypothetical protein